MFSKITDIIREKGNGARAYEAAAAAARQAALDEPDHAAGYFVLAVAAQEFFELNYDQALQAHVLTQELQRFETFVRMLDIAFQDQDSGAPMRAVSDIAVSIIRKSCDL